MINFRFHLVSLTAVFFALAVGIGIGATVVDQATVDLLERQLGQVEARRDRTNTENDELRAELGRWEEFSRQAGNQVVAGRLRGIPVLIVAFAGADRAPIDALRQATVAAGATLEGTVWFTSKWRLSQPDHVRELASIVGLSAEERPDTVRRAALSKVAAAWAGGERASLMPALLDAAFVAYEAPAEPPASVASLPLPGSRFVVVSGDKAEVPNEQLAVVFTQLLAQAAAMPVVAAEPGSPVRPRPEPGANFVGTLRASSDVASRISTVDNLDDYRGRVAAVLAIDHLGHGRTGHFGVRPGAQRLVPEPAP